MTFMHMSLLAGGLACVAIPVLIHLLMNRRRKPVRWGAMRFLREAYRRQRKRLLVERWLLLAVRCLMLVLLAAAVARPIAGAISGSGGRARTVYLLIDNSITGALRDGDGAGGTSALERHKALARSVIGELGRQNSGVDRGGGSGQRIGLVTLAGPAEGVVLPPSTDLEGVARQIEALTAQDARADLASAVAIVARDQGQSDRRDDQAPPVLIVLSDHLAGTIDIGQAGSGGADTGAVAGAPAVGSLPAGTTVVVLSPEEVACDNVSIVGVEPLRRVLVDDAGASGRGGEEGSGEGGNEQVRVTLARSGPGVARSAVTHVSLSVAGVVSKKDAVGTPATGAGESGAGTAGGSGVVRWSAGEETTTITLPIERSKLGLGSSRAGAPGSAGTSGEPGEGASGSVLTAIVARIDDDALSRDNVAAGPVEVRRSIRVAVLAPRRIETLNRADNLDAGSWARLALLAGGSAREGEASAGIEVVQIDPSAIETARLSSLDAAIVARPDQVTPAGWQRLRLFVDGGGLLMLMPAAENPVQTWSDAASNALGLGWTCEREARSVLIAETPGETGTGTGGRAPALRAARASTPGAASRNPGPGTSPGVNGGRVDAGGSGTGTESEAAHAREQARVEVLGLIFGELADLTRGVRVERVLAMQSNQPDRENIAGGALLELEDGTAVLWAGRAGTAETQGAGGQGAAGSSAGSRGATGPSEGLVVYLATALDLQWTDLPAKPLMVPLMQEVVRQGVGASRAGGESIAGELPRVPSRTIELIPIVPSAFAERDTRGSETEEEASHRLAMDATTGLLREPVRTAGVWRAVDERGTERGLIAVNPDTRGGRTTPQARAAVAALWSRVVRGETGTDPASNAAGPSAEGIVWLARDSGTENPGVGSGAAASGMEPAGIGTAGRGLDAGGVATLLSGQNARDSRWSVPLLWALLAFGLMEMLLARWASHASASGSGSVVGQMWSRLTQATVGTTAVGPTPIGVAEAAGSGGEIGAGRADERSGT